MRYAVAQILFGLALVLLAWYFPHRTFTGRYCGIWRSIPSRLVTWVRRGNGPVHLAGIAAQIWGYLAIVSGVVVQSGLVQPERSALGLLLFANILGLIITGVTFAAVVWCDRRSERPAS